MMVCCGCESSATSLLYLLGKDGGDPVGLPAQRPAIGGPARTLALGVLPPLGGFLRLPGLLLLPAAMHEIRGMSSTASLALSEHSLCVLP